MSRRPALLLAVTAAAATALPAVASSPATAEDLTALVQPLAGSLGPGFVTVAAGLPFGMVTPGPITTTPAGGGPGNYLRSRLHGPGVPRLPPTPPPRPRLPH